MTVEDREYRIYRKRKRFWGEFFVVVKIVDTCILLNANEH